MMKRIFKAAATPVRAMDDRQYRILIEAVTGYAIYMLDPDGIVTTWNAGAERITGYRSGEIVGQPFSRFYSGGDQAIGEPQRALDRAALEGHFESCGWRVRKDGRRFWADVVVEPIRAADGALLGFAKITRDITARSEAQRKIDDAHAELSHMNAELENRVGKRTRALELASANLVAAGVERDRLVDELTALNVERGHFVHAASHDLREPLKMASLFSRRLSQRYADQLGERGKDDLSRVIQAIDHLSLLLDDLESFARLGVEAEKASWFFTEDVFEQVILMFHDEVRAMGARIECASPLPCLYGNPIRFHRLLQNLIGNALKYVPSGVAPLIRVSAERTDEFWTFSVKDNGIGIDPRHFEYIFQPFKRLHAKSDYLGSGLGLAICRKIVDGFGGKLSVSSAEGDGSTFSFTVRSLGSERETADLSRLLGTRPLGGTTDQIRL